MPSCKIISAVKLDVTKQSELLKQAETAIAECLGKSVQYVAVAYIQEGWMRFGGGSDPSAIIEISSIGAINSTNNTNLAERLSTLCEQYLGVPGARVFITFTDVPGANFAHGQRTFG